jgi:hypothetical protein
LPSRTPLLGPALGLGLLVVLAVGCGGPTAQISGHAKFADGSSIKGGVRKVIFAPTDDTTAEVRKAASAEIADDGSFAMYTRKAGDGVYKGKYAVTFMVLDNPRDGGLLVPEKYTYEETTPFKIEVTGDRSDLVFELEKP